MSKTKKPRLLTVKEARTKVLIQQGIIETQTLTINRLENEVKSLDGARANLKMMYDVHEKEMQKAKEATVAALASVRGLERTLDRTISVAEAYQAQVRGYEAETAGKLIKRALGKLAAPMVKSVKGFIERVKYRFRRRG